jgi:hypothetical protein
MIDDNDLRSFTDYNKGQIEAADRVLIEVIELFKEYKDCILLIGG